MCLLAAARPRSEPPIVPHEGAFIPGPEPELRSPPLVPAHERFGSARRRRSRAPPLIVHLDLEHRGFGAGLTRREARGAAEEPLAPGGERFGGRGAKAALENVRPRAAEAAVARGTSRDAEGWALGFRGDAELFPLAPAL